MKTNETATRRSSLSGRIGRVLWHIGHYYAKALALYLQVRIESDEPERNMDTSTKNTQRKTGLRKQSKVDVKTKGGKKA